MEATAPAEHIDRLDDGRRVAADCDRRAVLRFTAARHRAFVGRRARMGRDLLQHLPRRDHRPLGVVLSRANAAGRSVVVIVASRTGRRRFRGHHRAR